MTQKDNVIQKEIYPSVEKCFALFKEAKCLSFINIACINIYIYKSSCMKAFRYKYPKGKI